MPNPDLARVAEILTLDEARAALPQEAKPLDTAPYGQFVTLFYAFPSGTREVEGIYREGRFWGVDTEGWWEREGGMWIDGWILGWKEPVQ